MIDFKGWIEVSEGEGSNPGHPVYHARAGLCKAVWEAGATPDEAIDKLLVTLGVTDATGMVVVRREKGWGAPVETYRHGDVIESEQDA